MAAPFAISDPAVPVSWPRPATRSWWPPRSPRCPSDVVGAQRRTGPPSLQEILQGGLARTEVLEQKGGKWRNQDFAEGGSARNQSRISVSRWTPVGPSGSTCPPPRGSPNCSRRWWQTAMATSTTPVCIAPSNAPRRRPSGPIMLDLDIIDAHHHLTDLTRSYPWLEGPGSHSDTTATTARFAGRTCWTIIAPMSATCGSSVRCTSKMVPLTPRRRSRGSMNWRSRRVADRAGREGLAPVTERRGRTSKNSRTTQRSGECETF